SEASAEVEGEEGLGDSAAVEGSAAEVVVPAGNEGAVTEKRNRRDHACVK
ncbi:MAG: hypothetical protein QOD47_65, partial [Gemmatimonadaceae bacterium]|nr:hypothetical protein [Gemmatimonadaceae bacterium]